MCASRGMDTEKRSFSRFLSPFLLCFSENPCEFLCIQALMQTVQSWAQSSDRIHTFYGSLDSQHAEKMRLYTIYNKWLSFCIHQTIGQTFPTIHPLYIPFKIYIYIHIYTWDSNQIIYVYIIIYYTNFVWEHIPFNRGMMYVYLCRPKCKFIRCNTLSYTHVLVHFVIVASEWWQLNR